MKNCILPFRFEFPQSLRRHRNGLISATLVLCSSLVTSTAMADQTLLDANNQVTAAIGTHHLNYHESTATMDPLDSDKGSQVAYRLAVVRQANLFGISDIYLNAVLNYSKGSTTYDGYLQNSFGRIVSPYQTSTQVKTTDASLRIGRALHFMPNDNMQLIPYIGYGYHAWVRDSSADQYGYYERYAHQSISAGLLGQYAFTPKLVASADISVGKTFGAKMDASDIGGRFTLGNKPIVTGSLGIDYALTRHVHLNASYQIVQFEYGKSATVGNYYEPDSKTVEQQFLVGIGYAF